MRKSLSMRITEMMRDEDKALPLEERNRIIAQKTGAPRWMIESLRRDGATGMGND